MKTENLEPEVQASSSTPSSPPSSGKGAAEVEVFLRGTVSRITYKNAESGFGVIRIEAEIEASEKQTTVVGVLPSTIACGMNIIARGQWQKHPKFGRQFRAQSLTETEPTSKEAIVKYLGSGAIKGFGPVLAQRIVDAFGEEALRILDLEPERLREVPGIGAKKYIEIKAAWDQKRNLREVLLFFQNHNIPIGLAQRIYNTYGDKAIETVQQNPYVLSRDVWGIGFQTADRIARALGIDPRSSARITAGIAFTLKRAHDDGHCFLPRYVLLAKTGSLLGIGEEELLVEGLTQSVREGELIEEGENIYLPSLYAAEEELAHAISKRIGPDAKPLVTIADNLVAEVSDRAVVTPGGEPSNAQGHSHDPRMIRLSEQQKDAIHLAASNQLVVITGGPGCGKTTVIKTIASLFRQAGLQIKLAAPTGRAAQRLAEVCGMESSTIHRLLKFEPQTRSFLHDHNFPLPLDALIVDESSMIDVPLAAALLRAVPPGARVVVVGDADQLPSVGPGLFLADLLNIDAVPRVRLTTLFRRADESLITHLAHKINSGKVPEIPEPEGGARADAYFIPAAEVTDAAALIERLVCEQVPKKFGFTGSDITVLTPMNQGELGVIALNRRLQARLVPAHAGFRGVKVGDLEFRLGDRVCQRVNNYNIIAGGVFNGDQGQIVGIDAEANSIRVRLWDGREVDYDSGALYQLDLAYALTIHRSQGSEVPVIILALHDTHSILLERQLIYTAVTRAKKLLIIVGTRRALILATKRTRSQRRYTALAEKVVRLTE